MITPYRPTDDEKAVAMLVAKRRNTLNGGGSNLPLGETQTDQQRLEQHYVAALAEIAVSRSLNLAWTGLDKGSRGMPDVGDALEVRSITDPKRGLLVRDRDENRPFVLVHVDKTNGGACTLLGWDFADSVRTYGAKLDADTDRPCWVAPAELLRPMYQLIQLRRP